MNKKVSVIIPARDEANSIGRIFPKTQDPREPWGSRDRVGVMSQLSRPTQSLQPKVVAAIPCFNTERFIGDVVTKTRKYVDQVIVVDDGSYDGTIEAVR